MKFVTPFSVAIKNGDCPERPKMKFVHENVRACPFFWEPLPMRTLLAAAGSVELLDDGTLSIVGTGGDDVIFGQVDGPDVIVHFNGELSRFVSADISQVVVHGGDGDDQVQGIPAEAPISLYGGNGDDFLGTAEYRNGGPGNDVFDQFGIVDYSDRDVPIRFDAGITNEPGGLPPTVFVGDDEQDILSDVVLIRGTPYDDVFAMPVANGFDWRIEGLGGDDKIVAGADLTEFDAGPGRDTIDVDQFPDEVTYTILPNHNIEVVENIGLTSPRRVRDESGAAQLFICADFYVGDGEQSVTIWAGGGNDTIIGSPGRDSLMGEDGFDRIAGGGENDTLRGGASRDILVGNGGADRLYGDGGNDQLLGEGGNDTIQGNSGHDNLHGGSGDDRLFGGSGNDTIDGGGGRDLLDGQAGNDILYAKDGLIDTLIGGAGFDRARRDNTATARDVVDGIEAFV